MTTPLGEFEQLLLFALLKTGDGASSLALRQAIEDRTGRVVTAGAVYTALDRMEGRGFVKSWLTAPTEGRGTRRVKRYGLEASGARALQRTYHLVQQMAKGLSAKLAEAAEESSS